MVHFAEAEEADQCVEYMNQRYLGKRRLLASTWDGKTKYEVEESEAEREERLKKWVDFLETGESADKNIASTASTDTGEHSGNGVSLEHSGNGVSLERAGNGASVNVGNGASIHIQDSNTISKGEGSETGQSGTSSSVPVAPIDSDSANVEESSTSEEKEMDTSETSMDADKSTESATHEKS